MILTGAFLADSAAAVDNKLNVSGGVLSRFALGPDRSARFTLVVLTQSDPDNNDRKLEIEMRPPSDADPIKLDFEVPESAVAEFPGFAFFELQLQLPDNGRWVMVLSAGTGAISLPILVSDLPPTTFGF
ncbi:hypothetical protein BST27_24280 [Mycobacterium intermedium]|uniref:YtkA-like domain-containing protein n=1 Tax=Mycobacterium intermedium TaxID=28445 RepID=A0A1E3SJQ7_MYCIE|nr:hypothetical protein [Mycobacterium intermedium]MCV6962570.1 hypothetical protein [Mycobacterium intermedium]ODR02341.1 hypothetical protein BHQ20_04430 [Mycobacterium intermedium]OPE52827.1 hypothetical protein BV508_00945 [Mycobacterium intermedium]ORA96733.1 hypothetical protein BST27_24280 [Mycobacterium intermedium]